MYGRAPQEKLHIETIFPKIELENEAGDMGAMLRLNEAGRRYLVQDGSSISKGVEVLCDGSNEINCVFLHLLENPTLCDTSAGESNGRSTNPTASSSGGGKRERASLHVLCRQQGIPQKTCVVSIQPAQNEFFFCSPYTTLSSLEAHE
jgi:hypothetical protein